MLSQRKWEVRRAYADELNKTRFLRVAEVWESVSTYNSDMARAFASYWDDSAKIHQAVIRRIREKGYYSEQEALRDPEIVALLEQSRTPINELERRSAEVLAFAERNRFWLGETRYRAVEHAVRLSKELALSAQPLSANEDFTKRNNDLKSQYERTQEQFEHLRDTLWAE